MRSLRNHRSALVARILVLLFTASCDDDIGGGPSAFTLESVWPNDDGTFWSYDGLQQNWEPRPYTRDWQPDRVYPTRGQVPPVPSFEMATRMLRDEVPGEPLASTTLGYGLQFRGLAFTRPDAIAQNLVPSFTIPAITSTEPMPANPMLTRLAVARPELCLIELKSRIELEEQLEAPLLLHGGAWERTEDWIGTYGSLDVDLAWKYLEANLGGGYQFTFQLVKTIATDVFLHAKVVGTPRISVGSDDSQFALEVIYIVDYGISEAVTSGGETLGYFRAYSLGRVFYVPNVGPVQSEERGAYFVGEASPERPFMTQTLRLRAAGHEIPPGRGIRARP
ncbi:MAG TPA: hypothetical protein VFD07_03540 [Candidatus Krumholzibacteria bacterium]|nr:hypothetical protein [Candidatus Krumholzibacteria bacterium]